MTPAFLVAPPRHLFFTGKGGVGKTSLACASAIALADRGLRVLVVSTDPASNLDEVLETKLATTPTAITSVPGLFAANLDPEAAAALYRDRIVGPYRNKLPAQYLAQMEEQLSGACTVEIAAFDEFARLIGDPSATDGFDHVIFDTAPTGHTLRLLSLPSAWTDFIRDNRSGSSCIGPLAGLTQKRAIYEEAIAALGDAARTVVVLVSRLDVPALAEAGRTSDELSALGIANQVFVLNGVFSIGARVGGGQDAVATAFSDRAAEAREGMPPNLSRLPLTELPLSPRSLLGTSALRSFLDGKSPDPVAVAAPSFGVLPTLRSLVDELAKQGRGVVMTMGKGGVGKTTVAAAIAIELARRGHRVQLTTTDPAAHLAEAVEEVPAGLTVSRIDPALETRRYVDEVMKTAGAGLDAQGLALLDEDLRSPCTEEVAVFRAFARTVEAGAGGFVVVDTAPTGHTLLLLDAAEAYHREVSRQGSAAAAPAEVRDLLPRLRDHAFTRILIVTLPEATPVHEAERLQSDLVRAGIHPFAWVVNQSFAPLSTTDAVLAARRENERPWIDEVRAHLASRTALVPWMTEAPRGASRLAALLG